MKLFLSILIIQLLFTLRLISNDSAAFSSNSSFNYSFSINSFPLYNGLLNADGEIKINDESSYGGFITLGTFPKEASDESCFFGAIGLSYRRYILGDFDKGLHIGTEAYYSGVNYNAKTFTFSPNNNLSMLIYNKGRSIIGIAFLGYKYTFPNGFTLEAQSGCGGGMNKKKIDYTDGTSSIKVFYNKLYYKLSLNIGWSFL